MQAVRALTIHFLDGTHISFGFPAQRANDAARSIMLEEIMAAPNLMIEADGALLIYPVSAIKSVQLTDLTGETIKMPSKNIIRGATVIT